MKGWIVEGGFWWRWIPKIYTAMAVWPLVLVRSGSRNPVLLRHERIHLAQQSELLVLPFYVWYLLEYVWFRCRGLGHWAAYTSISFEREAYGHERDTDYLERRRFWAFIRTSRS